MLQNLKVLQFAPSPSPSPLPGLQHMAAEITLLANENEGTTSRDTVLFL